MYREERLMVRRKKRKRVATLPRKRRELSARANERWLMDFTADSLATGRGFRALNVVDDFTRECVAIEVDTSISGERVARVLDRVIERRGFPKTLIVDNGPEFTSRALDTWAYERGIQLDFIRPASRLRRLPLPQRIPSVNRRDSHEHCAEDGVRSVTHRG